MTSFLNVVILNGALQILAEVTFYIRTSGTRKYQERNGTAIKPVHRYDLNQLSFDLLIPCNGFAIIRLN
jgi:hypothetical protein